MKGTKMRRQLKTNGEFESLDVLDEFLNPPKTPSFT